MKFKSLRELKKMKADVANKVGDRVRREIHEIAKSGFFPTHRQLIDAVMDELSVQMSGKPPLSTKAWSVLLKSGPVSKSSPSVKSIIQDQ